MTRPGPLLASGRDADIYEYGPGLVLRKSRDGRSLAKEAQIMNYLHRQGYPVPAIDQLIDGESGLVMERIEGSSMVDAITAAPWSIRRQARTLAGLHQHLHELDAPDFFPPSPPGGGGRILHLDLHPLNVMITKKRAVVIDWANVNVGDPLVDVALAWVLMAAGEVPSNRLIAPFVKFGRAQLVSGFVSCFDREDVTARLRAVVEVKVKDAHMSEAEIAGMWKVVAEAEARV
jgi:aminoglycoside phosphotransferase (APT) family kinase protein